jgi:hypothetical protein
MAPVRIRRYPLSGHIVADNGHIPDVDRWVRRGDCIYVKKVYYQSRRK